MKIRILDCEYDLVHDGNTRLLALFAVLLKELCGRFPCLKKLKHSNYRAVTVNNENKDTENPDFTVFMDFSNGTEGKPMTFSATLKDVDHATLDVLIMGINWAIARPSVRA